MIVQPMNQQMSLSRIISKCYNPFGPMLHSFYGGCKYIYNDMPKILGKPSSKIYILVIAITFKKKEEDIIIMCHGSYHVVTSTKEG
jgi:hypothetical protein